MRRSLSGLGTLGLAGLLAMLVWFVAVNEANPFESRSLPDPVAVTLLNLPDDLIIISTEPATAAAAVTLRAPRSVWDQLTPSQVRVTANLAGLEPATYEVPLQWEIAGQPAARVVRLEPAAVVVTLERRVARDKPLRLDLTGEPAPGYEAGLERLGAASASVAGPASTVDRVSELVATVSLANLKNSLDQTVVLVPVDADRLPVTGVTVTPATVRVRVPITQKVGSRDVAVRAIISGQIAAGYRITNITVAPPIITVSSSNPAQVSELPGFVETAPLDITGASDDVTQRLSLMLPEGVAPVGDDPTVVVQVSIAAIEGSTQIQRQLELLNLGAGLTARASPESVDVLLSGPIPILEGLQDADARVLLDLTGLGVGIYQVQPTVLLLPDKLQAVTVRPSPVEVVIERSGTPTLSPTPSLTPTPTRTPAVTRTLAPTFTSSPTPTETPPPPDATPTPAP